MHPLTINAGIDLIGIDQSTTYARTFLGKSIDVVTAGVGARLKTGKPAIGFELLYSQFGYERE